MRTLTQEDVSAIRGVVKEEVKGEISGIKGDITEIMEEQNRQGVLYEFMDGKIDTALELLTSDLRVKGQVDGHERRVQQLEADNIIMIPTIKIHSHQIKALTRRKASSRGKNSKATANKV